MQAQAQKYIVTAAWDDEAKVWVAESEDIPGLVTESETIEGLLIKLEVMVPELLELNLGQTPKGVVPIQLQTEHSFRVAS